MKTSKTAWRRMVGSRASGGYALVLAVLGGLMAGGSAQAMALNKTGKPGAHLQQAVATLSKGEEEAQTATYTLDAHAVVILDGKQVGLDKINDRHEVIALDVKDGKIVRIEFQTRKAAAE